VAGRSTHEKNAFPTRSALVSPGNTHLGCVFTRQGTWTLPGSGSPEIDDRCDHSRNENPQELEPVEEGYTNELRLPNVIERRIKQDDKWDDQQDEKPGTLPSRSAVNHTVSPFVHCVQEQLHGKQEPQGIRECRMTR
jgi:hypothetical protein